MERKRLRPPGAPLKRLKSYAETLSILLIDLISLFLIFKLSIIIRRDILPHFYSGFPPSLPFEESGLSIIWIFGVWLFLFYYEGLYTSRFSFWDEVKAEWKASFFSTVGIFVIVSLGKLSADVSRTVIVLMGLTALMVMPFTRMSAKKLLKTLGLFRRKSLIIGAGSTGRLILNALRREPNYGYEVAGFLDDDPEKIGTVIDGVKVHRGVETADSYIRSCGITDVIIAMPGAGKEKLQGLINNLQHEAERILFVPDIFGMAVLGARLEHFFHEQAFAIEIKNNLSQPLNAFIKRFFDIFMGGALVIVLFIPMLFIAFLIRLSSPGKAIFAQQRVGRNGKRFMCLKFRTMYMDSEDRLEELFLRDEGAKKQWEKRWKLKDDPRVTAVGGFLRSTSLDELPQLLNVLKGDMSLVGPRPYLPAEVEIIGGEGMGICLSVLPGITGLWQVSGRSDTGYEYRNALDSWYVRNWNLWLDVVILIKTVSVVLGRKGAF
jgi:undecaprenyl-phosphate galactose phosphotransferase